MLEYFEANCSIARHVCRALCHYYSNTAEHYYLLEVKARLRPFGPALGPSGLLDNVLHALRALRPCDPCISAIKKCPNFLFGQTEQ